MKIKKRHIKMARCADRAWGTAFRFMIRRGVSSIEADKECYACERAVVRWYEAANAR